MFLIKQKQKSKKAASQEQQASIVITNDSIRFFATQSEVDVSRIEQMEPEPAKRCEYCGSFALQSKERCDSCGAPFR